MSSTTTTSPYFLLFLDAALDGYTKQTVINLTKHLSADKFQSCRTSEDSKYFRIKKGSAPLLRPELRGLVLSRSPPRKHVHHDVFLVPANMSYQIDGLCDTLLPVSGDSWK
jgi:hypothetical protein